MIILSFFLFCLFWRWPADNFAGFDTKVLEFKTVCNMKGNLGRTRRMSAFVITGNGNGLAGFALAKAQAGQAALRKAKNRAAQKLMYVERYNDHTGECRATAAFHVDR